MLPFIVAGAAAAAGLAYLFGKDEKPDEVQSQADHDLPSAKGKLTRTLGQLSTALQEAQSLREQIYANDDLQRAVESLNKTLRLARAEVKDMRGVQEQSKAAVGALHQAANMLVPSDGGIEIPSPAKSLFPFDLSVELPKLAKEHEFPVLEAAIRKDVASLHEFQQASQKAKKLLVAVRSKTETAKGVLSELSGLQGLLDDQGLMPLEAAQKVVLALEFLGSNLITRGGNLAR
jgi:uncharacterized protein GlcG (DUF336 family)